MLPTAHHLLELPAGVSRWGIKTPRALAAQRQASSLSRGRQLASLCGRGVGRPVFAPQLSCARTTTPHTRRRLHTPPPRLPVTCGCACVCGGGASVAVAVVRGAKRYQCMSQCLCKPHAYIHTVLASPADTKPAARPCHLHLLPLHLLPRASLRTDVMIAGRPFVVVNRALSTRASTCTAASRRSLPGSGRSWYVPDPSHPAMPCSASSASRACSLAPWLCYPWLHLRCVCVDTRRR